jgi:hypothetical protein
MLVPGYMRSLAYRRGTTVGGDAAIAHCVCILVTKARWFVSDEALC